MAGFQPFSRIASPFSIGLTPLSEGRFLHQDEQLQTYLEQKRHLYATGFNDVFRAEPETIDAQREAADLIHSYIGAQDQDNISKLPPLAAAALRVADDLVLMRRDDAGWRLVAASVCFPSSWNLDQKFGLPLERIHGPVPGMEGKTNTRIRRVFDMLRSETPLWRENWALETDGTLRLDKQEYSQRAKQISECTANPGDVWLRTEYQTLHKLPQSGDVLFTIKVMVQTLDDISRQSDGPILLGNLHHQLFAMDKPQRAYKGIDGDVDKFMNYLLRHSEIQPQQKETS